MHPDETTDSVLRALATEESHFHHPPVGTTRARLERMLAPGFRETGASGASHSRADALAVLWTRIGGSDAGDWHCSDLAVVRVASDCYLLTYVLDQGQRRTRRATLWRRQGDAWTAVFHQGTLVTG